MPIAPLPTPLQDIGGRRFSFYPPIRNIAHNEWMYRRSNWSESVVVNMRSGEEVCIPRMFLGEVSIDESVVIVGLVRELEWNAGVVVPHQRRVIELPVAVNEGRPAPVRPHRTAEVINIRLEQPKRDLPAGKWLGVIFGLGAVAFTIVASIARQTQTRLGPGDDYTSIVKALGKPAEDRTITSQGRQYRQLTYPARHFSVLLSEGRYAGALDMYGRQLGETRR
jgi:hypothetical protein